MEPDSTFTRRVCAVLLADVSGFSALMGEDDERTAHAVQHLQALVHGIVAEAKGRSESVAGDALFATFDSVVAAVEAALNIQRRIASEEFTGHRLQIRIGVHFGDVLLREGAAFGDAINVAARLQALARPGTICVSEGVYRQVRNKFDEKFVDLGRQRLKNISDPVRAYLLVPREMEEGGARSMWTSWLVGAGALAALFILGFVAAQRYRSTPAENTKPSVSSGALPHVVVAPTAKVEAITAPEQVQQIALGVMSFKNLSGDGGNDWRREVLRDGLNTQLSQLSRVKVYSKEFIDFLITRKGLTEIEAATQLGIRKMLSGSFLALGKTLRIETHVVDVATGVLETSYTTTGSEEKFLDLQNQLALEAIARLDLPVTEEEKKTLLAQQENTTVEALKLLLEAEGASGGKPVEPTSQGSPSTLRSWFALMQPFASVASADEGAPAEGEIREVLERYRRATEAKEIEKLASVYTEFPPDQQEAQQRYFENTRDLQVKLEDIDVVVVGDEAVVSYTRIDDFADIRTGRPMHVSVRLTKTLRRENGTWKMAAGR
jgi:class 3 adenylate cyclase/TolB-like protein/ketosteroid isomerase-like protein